MQRPRWVQCSAIGNVSPYFVDSKPSWYEGPDIVKVVHGQICIDHSIPDPRSPQLDSAVDGGVETNVSPVADASQKQMECQAVNKIIMNQCKCCRFRHNPDSLQFVPDKVICIDGQNPSQSRKNLIQCNLLKKFSDQFQYHVNSRDGDLTIHNMKLHRVQESQIIGTPDVVHGNDYVWTAYLRFMFLTKNPN